jgi:hypothetical protein
MLLTTHNTSNNTAASNPNKFIKITGQSYKVVDIKKFCVDPQVTSFDVLAKLVAQAFGLKE